MQCTLKDTKEEPCRCISRHQDHIRKNYRPAHSYESTHQKERGEKEKRPLFDGEPESIAKYIYIVRELAVECF